MKTDFKLTKNYQIAIPKWKYLQSLSKVNNVTCLRALGYPVMVLKGLTKFGIFLLQCVTVDGILVLKHLLGFELKERKLLLPDNNCLVHRLSG